MKVGSDETLDTCINRIGDDTPACNRWLSVKAEPVPSGQIDQT